MRTPIQYLNYLHRENYNQFKDKIINEKEYDEFLSFYSYFINLEKQLSRK